MAVVGCTPLIASLPATQPCLGQPGNPGCSAGKCRALLSFARVGVISGARPKSDILQVVSGSFFISIRHDDAWHCRAVAIVCVGDQWVIAEGIMAAERIELDRLQKVRPGMVAAVVGDTTSAIASRAAKLLDTGTETEQAQKVLDPRNAVIQLCLSLAGGGHESDKPN